MKRRLSSGPLLAGVIAAAGADQQALVARRAGFDLDASISALGLRPERLVADGVLVADVVRDRLGDGIHFAEVPGEEGNAAGLFRHFVQSAAGTADVLFLVENADGVHGRTVFRL